MTYPPYTQGSCERNAWTHHGETSQVLSQDRERTSGVVRMNFGERDLLKRSTSPLG